MALGERGALGQNVRELVEQALAPLRVAATIQHQNTAENTALVKECGTDLATHRWVQLIDCRSRVRLLRFNLLVMHQVLPQKADSFYKNFASRVENKV